MFPTARSVGVLAPFLYRIESTLKCTPDSFTVISALLVTPKASQKRHWSQDPNDKKEPAVGKSGDRVFQIEVRAERRPQRLHRMRKQAGGDRGSHPAFISHNKEFGSDSKGQGKRKTSQNAVKGLGEVRGLPLGTSNGEGGTRARRPRKPLSVLPKKQTGRPGRSAPLPPALVFPLTPATEAGCRAVALRGYPTPPPSTSHFHVHVESHGVNRARHPVASHVVWRGRGGLRRDRLRRRAGRSQRWGRGFGREPGVLGRCVARPDRRGARQPSGGGRGGERQARRAALSPNRQDGLGSPGRRGSQPLQPRRSACSASTAHFGAGRKPHVHGRKAEKPTARIHPARGGSGDGLGAACCGIRGSQGAKGEGDSGWGVRARHGGGRKNESRGHRGGWGALEWARRAGASQGGPENRPSAQKLRGWCLNRSRQALDVPFPSTLEAEIARGSLAPDADPTEAVRKELTVTAASWRLSSRGADGAALAFCPRPSLATWGHSRVGLGGDPVRCTQLHLRGTLGRWQRAQGHRRAGGRWDLAPPSNWIPPPANFHRHTFWTTSSGDAPASALGPLFPLSQGGGRRLRSNLVSLPRQRILPRGPFTVGPPLLPVLALGRIGGFQWRSHLLSTLLSPGPMPVEWRGLPSGRVGQLQSLSCLSAGQLPFIHWVSSEPVLLGGLCVLAGTLCPGAGLPPLRSSAHQAGPRPREPAGLPGASARLPSSFLVSQRALTVLPRPTATLFAACVSCILPGSREFFQVKWQGRSGEQPALQNLEHPDVGWREGGAVGGDGGGGRDSHLTACSSCGGSVIVSQCKSDGMSPLLRSLHWLHSHSEHKPLVAPSSPRLLRSHLLPLLTHVAAPPDSSHLLHGTTSGWSNCSLEESASNGSYTADNFAAESEGPGPSLFSMWHVLPHSVMPAFQGSSVPCRTQVLEERTETLPLDGEWLDSGRATGFAEGWAGDSGKAGRGRGGVQARGRLGERRNPATFHWGALQCNFSLDFRAGGVHPEVFSALAGKAAPVGSPRCGLLAAKAHESQGPRQTVKGVLEDLDGAPRLIEVEVFTKKQRPGPQAGSGEGRRQTDRSAFRLQVPRESAAERAQGSLLSWRVPSDPAPLLARPSVPEAPQHPRHKSRHPTSLHQCHTLPEGGRSTRGLGPRALRLWLSLVDNLPFFSLILPQGADFHVASPPPQHPGCRVSAFGLFPLLRSPCYPITQRLHSAQRSWEPHCGEEEVVALGPCWGQEGHELPLLIGGGLDRRKQGLRGAFGCNSDLKAMIQLVLVAQGLGDSRA
ncbi:hypothetical protein Cadr_000002444 [Camelus dromedarius]|uniref:Uncharacterized protein n=1 Tax=Camelus dromedarius TaxID=9838 RepID=A0A5N4C1G0_CAMDR|nr:hypothetical protein Cadr_000002444 [Camelus dromedarius]